MITKSHKNNLPCIAKDSETIKILEDLKLFAERIGESNSNGDIELRVISSYIFLASEASMSSSHELLGLKNLWKFEKECVFDWFFESISYKNPKYIEEVLNREVGIFREFFPEFQNLVIKLSNSFRKNPEYETIEFVFGSLYACFFDSQKRLNFVTNYSLLIEIITEELLSQKK